MQLPQNFDLPFFTYGIFRPRQLCYFQIKKFVREIKEPVQIDGSLLERDGLPIIDRDGNEQVKGALLFFTTSGTAKQAYERISALEPSKHYFWEEAQCDGTTANVLFGKSPTKGSYPAEYDEWDGWADPLFKSALEVVEETLHSQEKFEWNLKPLFRLQMAYLLLWSAIERYVSIRYHLGRDPTEKINKLADEAAFGESLKRHVTEPREVFRADNPGDKETLDAQSPKKSVKYYYQIRCNITHRGKAVSRDHDRIRKSLSELLPIFRDVLKAAQDDALLSSRALRDGCPILA